MKVFSFVRSSQETYGHQAISYVCLRRREETFCRSILTMFLVFLVWRVFYSVHFLLYSCSLARNTTGSFQFRPVSRCKPKMPRKTIWRMVYGALIRPATTSWRHDPVRVNSAFSDVFEFSIYRVNLQTVIILQIMNFFLQKKMYTYI